MEPFGASEPSKPSSVVDDDVDSFDPFGAFELSRCEAHGPKEEEQNEELIEDSCAVVPEPAWESN